MKLSIYLFAAVSVLTLVAVGCSTEKKPASASGSALDVGHNQPAPAVSSTPVYTPPPTPVYVPPAQPTADQWATTATPTITETPKTSAKSADASGSSYTVKKGDTLYKIAKDHYGDAKMINKIAAANPGMDPNKLKIGQKITLPAL